MSNSQKTMVGGAAVLSLAGLICKVVGALYRVPLSHIIGENGMATYQLVFPTYNLLLTISSAGLPAAISQMVSHYIARGDPDSGKKTFRCALWLMLALGMIGTILMVVFRGQLAAFTKDPATEPGFAAIAPALLLVCLLSAYRGFLQGQQNMVPTAVSQLIEQVGKVAICLPLSYWGMQVSVAYAAAGMLLGTSIAEAVALVYMMIVTKKGQPAYSRIPQLTQSEPSGAILRQLVLVSLPVTLSACIVPASGFIDSGMVLSRLTEGAGLAMEVAKPLYGAYSGYVLTLINVPTAIATALCTSLVPSISAAHTRQDAAALGEQVEQGLKISFLIGLPCSLGMSLLSRELLSLIYHFSSVDILNRTAQVFSLSAFTVIFFTLVQSTTGILTGLKKQHIPMYTLLAGVVLKVGLNYLLIGTPGIGMLGAPIASLVCYGLSTLGNLYFALKYSHQPFLWKDYLLKPLAATGIMGAVIFLMKKLLPSSRLVSVLLILVGVGVYFGAALLVGAITPRDLAPFVKKIRKK